MKHIPRPSPLISVILPACNVAEMIEPTIHTALAQQFSSLEVVVVDDASTDATSDRVMHIAQADERVRLLRNSTTAGPAATRNRGIEAAQGNHITFLEVQDIWKPGRLAHMARVMADSAADFVADNILFGEEGAVQETASNPAHARPLTYIDAAIFFARAVEESATFHHLKPMLRRQFLIDHDIRYREAIHRGGDFLFHADLFMAGARGLFIADACHIRPTPGDGLSAPDILEVLEELEGRANLATRREIRRYIHGLRSNRPGNKGRNLWKAGGLLASVHSLTRQRLQGGQHSAPIPSDKA